MRFKVGTPNTERSSAVLTARQAAAPNLQGMGRLRDLREAANDGVWIMGFSGSLRGGTGNIMHLSHVLRLFNQIGTTILTILRTLPNIGHSAQSLQADSISN